MTPYLRRRQELLNFMRTMQHDRIIEIGIQKGIVSCTPSGLVGITASGVMDAILELEFPTGHAAAIAG